jgi:hypothetical protein
LARKLFDETEVVKCGRDIEEFRVEAEFLLAALLSPEEVDAGGMIKEQLGGVLTQDACCLFREQGIGDDHGGRRV